MHEGPPGTDVPELSTYAARKALCAAAAEWCEAEHFPAYALNNALGLHAGRRIAPLRLETALKGGLALDEEDAAALWMTMKGLDETFPNPAFGDKRAPQ